MSKAGSVARVSIKKRKHDSDASDDESPAIVSITTAIKKRKIVTTTPPDTPTKVLKHTLATFNISSPAPALKRKQAACPILDIAIPSPPCTPPPSNDSDDVVEQLEDLKSLASAFLSSLSLQYAHNGNSNSVDLRMLTPSITKLWGKRKVTIDDLRLLVAITHSSSNTSSRFLLKDFGDGKVCVEMIRAKRGRGSLKASLNEAEVKAIFAANLETAWNSWTTQNSDTTSAEEFIKSLPLEKLTTSSTVSKIAPLRAKGQRRLEEVLTPFKNFNISEDAEPSGKRTKTGHKGTGLIASVEEKENVRPLSPLDRTLSLLERIKVKEAIAANLPAAPTKEERERMAALQRSEELLEILNLLAVAKGGAARTSFPLSSLVGSIQSSIRSPMSKDEILRCVKVLQMEVAPGHISMVTFGSVTGVVVDRSRKPSLLDVKTKLRAKGVQC